jgi:hypothetical protein
VTEPNERRIDEILAPLGEITPADRRRGRPVIARHHRLAALAIALLVLLGVGATYAAYRFEASATPTPISPGGSLACLDLVGRSASHAHSLLAKRDLHIVWRLTHYSADGKHFTTTAPHSVPGDAIVEDAVSDGAGHVLLFVHLHGDAHAPAASPPRCR